MKKRFLPLFLCMVMFVSLLPIASLEASAVTNEYSNARQLKLGRSTNISVSESNGWEDFLYFTPDSSGWYTFTGTSSRIWLYDIVTSEEERPDSFNGDVSMLTGNGADVYLDAGKTYYLAFYFIGGAYNSSETKSAISVKKAETFDTISEGQRINLSFDAHLYWVDGGGGVPFKYLQFIPNNTAEYTINCSFSSWMGRGVGIVDSHGKSVSIEESGDWHPSKAEYKCALFAGKTYYIGIMVENWDSDTYCEISIVGKPSQSEGSQEQITDCTEHKYTSAGGNICTVCGYEFEPELIEYNKTLYAAIENAAVRSQPYAKAGALVDKLAKGEAVRVTHYFYNSLGSKWYKTENGNYIYSERLTSVSSGAKTYTLSFNANGSGVSNLPSSVNIREGVRYAIPGAASGVPERDGYNFIGYSTNKNAATAEYVPGKSIMLTSNLTLYAVWEKKTITYSDDIEDLVFSIINGVNADSKLGDTGQKYWSWYYGKPSSRSDAWCAVYTSWLLEQVGQSSIRTASPNEQVRKLTEAGCYHTKNYTPQTGDLVFFSKYGNNADHVGMIVIQEGNIYILHGNHSRKVCKSAMTDVWTNESRRLFGDYILGYGDMESYAEVTAN